MEIEEWINLFNHSIILFLIYIIFKFLIILLIFILFYTFIKNIINIYHIEQNFYKIYLAELLNEINILKEKIKLEEKKVIDDEELLISNFNTNIFIIQLRKDLKQCLENYEKILTQHNNKVPININLRSEILNQFDRILNT